MLLYSNKLRFVLSTKLTYRLLGVKYAF